VLDALVIDRFKHPRSMRDLLRFGGKLLMARWIFEKVNTAVRDTIRYGWSMFYPFGREEISPPFHDRSCCRWRRHRIHPDESVMDWTDKALAASEISGLR
jgi:hypothetical protein